MSERTLVDENQARAAAGLTLVAGGIAFAVALGGSPVLIRAVSVVFACDFAVRVFDRLEHSPVGFVAGWLVRWRPVELVSARPKRFAWTLGLVMAAAMATITNLGVRGTVPRTICVICLVLMWAEAALGLCLGCELYGVLRRRGLIHEREGFDVCASGACAVPTPADQAGTSRRRNPARPAATITPATRSSTTIGRARHGSAGTLGRSSNGDRSSTTPGRPSNVPNRPTTTLIASGVQPSATQRGAAPNSRTGIAVTTHTAGT